MKTVNVNANIQVPVNASKAQIDEWIKFHLGRANGISGDNPLFDEDDLLAETITVTENTTVRVNQAISLALAGGLETVNDSYENGELNIGISTEQLGHPRGDGLAEFLHTEICEATQGEDEQNTMNEVTKEMFLNWNGVNDTNPDYLTNLIVELLNNNDDDHISELKQAITKENRIVETGMNLSKATLEKLEEQRLRLSISLYENVDYLGDPIELFVAWRKETSRFPDGIKSNHLCKLTPSQAFDKVCKHFNQLRPCDLI